MAVQLYSSSTSVFPGDALRIHTAATDDEFQSLPYVDCRLTIECITANPNRTVVGFGDGVNVKVRSKTPQFDAAHANAEDCGWQFDDVVIPTGLPSGLYKASVSPKNGKVSDLMFVVKPPRNQPTADIICSIPFTTWYAYSPWFGKSLYDYNSHGGRAKSVSLSRPLASENDILTVARAEAAISNVCSADYWYRIREKSFLSWLRRQDLRVDYCSNIDLHSDPRLLDPYALLLSIGHDEYWSKEMRNSVEHFVAYGGNVAFFAANVSWFEIKFDKPDCRTMTCEKVKLSQNQRVLAGDANEFTASNWLSRPESSLSGVSFRMGAYNPSDHFNQTVGFKVLDANHWVLKDTGLTNGALFGQDAYMVGYETDAYCPPLGPRNFKKVAEASFSAEKNGTWKMTNVASKQGWATMGLFRPVAYEPLGQSNVFTEAIPGTVFTVGTTDWGRGLESGLKVATQITKNVLATLGRRKERRPNGLVAVYQYLPAGDLTNATSQPLRFYYSSSLDAHNEYGWCSDGVAFFAASTPAAFSKELLQYYRVKDGAWYYRYSLDPLPEDSGWIRLGDTGLWVESSGDTRGTVPIFEYRSHRPETPRYLYSPSEHVVWRDMELQPRPLFWAYGDLR